MDIEVAIVLGAGNIWRGRDGIAHGMERATADHMGMLATVMNGLALQDSLERIGVSTRVQTAIEMRAVAEPYIRLRAIRHLEKGRVVIFAAGTGNPFLTTDTAGCLRAVEIGADSVLKATKVNGVYDSDPVKNPDAVRYETLSYDEVLEKNLQVMDATAVVLCRDNNLPLRIFNLNDKGALPAAMKDSSIGTTVVMD